MAYDSFYGVMPLKEMARLYKFMTDGRNMPPNVTTMKISIELFNNGECVREEEHIIDKEIEEE